jgi:hypothetical protein
MPEGAVFLSYAHEDCAAARRLQNFLDQEAGIDVWFDEQEIKGGDDWSRKIRRNINNCSYFMPVISATATPIREGYFRTEWKLVVERASRFAEDARFIIPVAIDATPHDTASVPERFKQVRWTWVPDGEGTRAFSNLMITLLGDYRRNPRDRG